MIAIKFYELEFMPFVFIRLPRLQTGMRGAFGKPQGTVARVNIGQIIMSVRAKDGHKEKVIEALRRAKFKFPGRQKVSASQHFSLKFIWNGWRMGIFLK